MNIPSLEQLLFKGTDQEELLPLSEFLELITDLFQIRKTEELINLVKLAESIEA